MVLSSRTFSLRLLLGIVTVLAVAMAVVGAGLRHDGLDGPLTYWGILVAILGMPALVRASTMMRKHQAAGKTITWADRLFAFLTSSIVMLVVSIAASIAFVAVCFPVGLLSFGNGVGIVVAFILGGLTGGALGIWLLIKLWPER